MHVNWPPWADKNQIKCENVRFLSEMSWVWSFVNSPARIDENQLKCEKVRFFYEQSKINSGEFISSVSF